MVVAAVGHADEDGEGDGAGEPEEHGDGLEGQGGEAVEDAGEVERGDADVGKHEQRPDAIEQHKVDPVRRGAAPAVVIVAIEDADS